MAAAQGDYPAARGPARSIAAATGGATGQFRLHPAEPVAVTRVFPSRRGGDVPVPTFSSAPPEQRNDTFAAFEA